MLMASYADLLEDEDVNTEVRLVFHRTGSLSRRLSNMIQDIDLVHCRIRSIPALRLERFPNLQVRVVHLEENCRIECDLLTCLLETRSSTEPDLAYRITYECCGKADGTRSL